MMSAPSSASRMAWLRPWPRPAPVMNATLPSTRPMKTSLLVREAGVDGKRDAGDVPGLVGDQPEDRVGDVYRLDHAHRQRVRHRLAEARVLLQELLHDVVDNHRGVHPGGMHAVHPDAVRRQVVRVGAHQAYYAVLGRGVAETAAGGAADAVDAGSRAGKHDRAAFAAL